jgi:predicted dehydrogenase
LGKNDKIGVGIIGCGNISPIYCQTLKKFRHLDLTALADLDVERAKQRAVEFGIAKGCSVKEILADPQIKIIVNLTVPKSHAQVSLEAIRAGKSVYSEKPMAVTRADGERILKAAKEKRVLVGGAPDTFLGGGIQTCRKIIDDGWIGKPVAATAFMVCHGHEGWHPSPEFYYEIGGGPLFDMGPYYITALINLLGPVKRVVSAAKISFSERTITSKEKYGKKIKVETPTHITSIMDFESGAVGNMITSFDVWSHSLPCIEIYGSEGSLSVPDPNTFGGEIKIKRAGASEWQKLPLTHGYAENSRGLGVADMAASLGNKRPVRASGNLTFHVLDIMQSMLESAKQGKYLNLKSSCARPNPLPMGLRVGEVD